MRKEKSLTLVGLLVCLMSSLATAGDVDKAKSEAQSVGSGFTSYLRTNVSNFGGALTGKTHLKTSSGKSFDASIKGAQGSGNASYIKMMVSNGELYVEIPNLLRGTRASGVCENGFITCDAGTWNNCQYYLFKDGLLKKADSFQQLNSCFCISSGACNFSWNANWLKWALDKFTRMLNYTDKSYVDVIQYPTATRDFKAVKKLDVSEDKMRDTDSLKLKLASNDVIKRYKQNQYMSNSNTIECEISNYFNTYDMTIPTKLVFSNGKDLSGIVCSGIDNYEGEYYKCYLPDNLSVGCGAGFSYYVCGKFHMEWGVADDVGCSFSINDNNYAHCNVHGDDTEDEYGNLTADLSTGEVEDLNVWGHYACGGWSKSWDLSKAAPDGCGNVRFSIWNNGACNGAGWVKFYVIVKEIPTAKLQHTDTCGNISKDCRLKDEWVCFYPPIAKYKGIVKNYCVKTVSNYAPIRTNSLVPTCYNFKTSYMGNTWRVCLDGRKILAYLPRNEDYTFGDYPSPKGWTYVKRVYTCPEKEGIDVEKEVKRGNEIIKNSYFEGGKVGYSGQLGCIERNNKWICYANNEVFASKGECQQNCGMDTSVLVPSDKYKVCEKDGDEGVYVCKVAIGGHQVRVGKGDVEMQSQGNTYSFKDAKESEPNKIDKGNDVTYDIRACEQDDTGQLTCPVCTSAGERVVKNCYCDISGEAFRALSTLEAVDAASHDIICSKE